MHELANTTPTRPKNDRPTSRTRKATPDTALQFSTGRVRDIAALRGLGFSYGEIAGHFNVTPQAVSILLQRSRRQIDAIGGLPEMAGLSTRAVAALRRIGVSTPQEAARRDAVTQLRNARNCGTKTLEEISAWMLSAAAANRA